jgi:hypothetical protein
LNGSRRRGDTVARQVIDTTGEPRKPVEAEKPNEINGPNLNSEICPSPLKSGEKHLSPNTAPTRAPALATREDVETALTALAATREEGSPHYVSPENSRALALDR